MFDNMYRGASTSGGSVDTRAFAPPYRGGRPGADPDFMAMLASLLSNKADALPLAPMQRPGVLPVNGQSPDILADTPVPQLPATPAMNPQGPPPVPAQRPVMGGAANGMGATEPMGMMPAVASPAAQGKPAGSGLSLGYGSMMAGEAGMLPGEGGAEASYSLDELKAMLAKLLG